MPLCGRIVIPAGRPVERTRKRLRGMIAIGNLSASTTTVMLTIILVNIPSSGITLLGKIHKEVIRVPIAPVF